MGKIISDKEMDKIAPARNFISDDEMHKLEDPQDDKHWYDVSGKGLARGALDSLPILGGIGGAAVGSIATPVAGSIAGAGLGYAGGKELSDILKNKLLGDDADSVDPVEQAKRVASSTMTGATQEMGGQLLGAAVGKVADGAKWLGGKFGDKAEKLAVNATGATGMQANKFADDAGRELLDRKLVRFGDSPANVAERTSQAMEQAGDDISSSLKELDAKGVKANVRNVLNSLNAKIAELKLDPSQAGVVRKLEGIVGDIQDSGQLDIPLSAAEQTKRGFNKIAGNWMDPEVGQAGKEAYRGYMNEVEGAANKANPDLASKFAEGKKTYGLLAPIEEAAAKRASTVNQSPWGGLGDMSAAAAGGMTAGPVGAVAGAIGKKVIAPRLTSSAAVSLDKVSQLLMKTPQMAQLAQTNMPLFKVLAGKMAEKMSGPTETVKTKPYDQDAILEKTQGSKYASVLEDAAKRGDQAFGAAHFVLQSKDPKYREMTLGNDDDEDL